jgi:hypothetical protein
MVCNPRLIVDESRVNEPPVPRKPCCDEVQKSWPRTSAVPSESAPAPENVMTVLSGITAPSCGEEMTTVGGPIGAADAGVRESARDARTNAATKNMQVRTATPIVN